MDSDMTKKTTKPKKQAKLPIKDVLSAVDRRDYDFYQNLDQDQKKEFSPYVLMRYMSNVNGDTDTQEWFLERTNEMINKNHWILSKNHKPLLWKLYAGVGAGMNAFHPYLAMAKTELNKFEKLVAELNPSMKLEDVKFLSSMMTDSDKEELFDNMGFDKSQRSEYR